MISASAHARRQLLPGSRATDTGAINDGSAHAERCRRSTFIGGQELRRQRLLAALRRASSARRWVVDGAGRPSTRSRTPSGRPPRRATRSSSVDTTRGQLPDRRLRPDPGEELQALPRTASRSTKYLGNHEIKGGLEYEDAGRDVIKRMSGGQQVDDLPNNADPSRPVYSPLLLDDPDRDAPRQRADRRS